MTGWRGCVSQRKGNRRRKHAERPFAACARSIWAFESDRRSGKRDGFAGILLPCARRRLHALQPGGLFRVAPYQAEEGCELRIQVLVSFTVGLKEEPVAGEQKSAQSRFFVDHQFDQVVGVRDYLVGPVNPASTPLHLAESVSQ